MRVWRPLGVNNHANMLLWLAESWNELSNVELLLLVGSNNALQDVLMAFRNVEKSSHFRSIAEIKGPTMRVWRPLGVNNHANMLLWLAESRNEASCIALWLLMASKNVLQDVFMGDRIVEKSLHFRSIAEIKGPIMRVWRPF